MRLITDRRTGITRPVCQHTDDDILCGNPGNSRCKTCGRYTCGPHTRWHHEEGRIYDTPLCQYCDGLRRYGAVK